MRGTKRFAASDSNLIPNDSILSKRILAGSPSDTQRAEPSQEQLVTASPPLDMQRAELSRQHVRALNTQFASWIQTQLEKHPDELWEDGVEDYLNHAKSIMEKFSDVVSWLKANAAKAEKNSIVGSDATQKKFGIESKEKENNFLFGKPATFPATTTASLPDTTQKKFGFESKDKENNFLYGKPAFSPASTAASPPASTTAIAPASTTASFGMSWGSGVPFSSTPFSFGIQSSVHGSQNLAPTKHDASNDLDGEDDIEQPSSPSVKKTEEKGIDVVHEVRCKLYVKSSDPTDKGVWKDKGSGQLSIRCKEGVGKGTTESKPTIVVRNDVGKVLLNALLYPGIKTNVQKNSVVAIFHTSGDGDKNDTVVAGTYSIRTKSEEERDKLAEVIKEYAPAG